MSDLLHKNYSTTKLLIKKQPELINKPKDKFQTILFSDRSDKRLGEGGLRTRGYFKYNLPDKPLITIITVVFNGSKYFEESIMSVLNQTYENIEYIIIDGGSTDGTLEIIEKHEDVIDYWVSEKDNGIYDAMNKAICLSSGKYIYHLGSDDFIYHADSMENLIIKAKNRINTVIAGITIDGSKIFKSELNKDLSYRNTIHHQSALYPVNIFKRIGLYNMKYNILADLDMNQRIFLNKSSFNFEYIDYIICFCRDEGISKRSKIAIKIERLFLIKSLFLYIKYKIIKLVISKD